MPLIASVLLVLALSTVHSTASPTDKNGYWNHLRELCQNGSAQEMPGTSFVKSNGYCTLYIESPFASDAPCDDKLESCTRKLLETFFNVPLSNPIGNYTRCDERGCKIYYNFRDEFDFYESATQCGFDIGGIAMADGEQKISTYIVSVSINKNCIEND